MPIQDSANRDQALSLGWAVSLALTTVWLGSACRVHPLVEAPEPDAASPMETIVLEGTIHLYTFEGDYAQINPQSLAVRWLETDGEVKDLAVQSGRLHVLLEAGDRLSLAVLDQDSWRLVETWRAPERDRVGLISTRDQLIAKIGDHLYFPESRRPKVELPQSIGNIFAASRAGLIYGGSDRGEWGGELTRTDPTTGRVVSMSSRKSGDRVCSGKYVPECDPVTTIVPDLQDDRCVYVGVGLSHLTISGRLLRVCEREIEVVWPADWSSARSYEETAVFDLQYVGDELYIASSRGVLVYGQDEATELEWERLDYEDYSGLRMARGSEQLIVIDTDAYRFTLRTWHALFVGLGG